MPLCAFLGSWKSEGGNSKERVNECECYKDAILKRGKVRIQKVPQPSSCCAIKRCCAS